MPDRKAASRHEHEHGPDCDHDHGPPPEPFRRAEPKIGRNDPCHCGSGKKFKKCHGAVTLECAAALQITPSVSNW